MTDPTRHPIVSVRTAARKIAVLFGRPVTVGWIVLVVWVLAVSFALIAYSVKRNFEQDRVRDEITEYTNCLEVNARRADVKVIALQFVENDRFFIEFIDGFIPDGLPLGFKEPLLKRYTQQVADIEDAYEPSPCPKARRLR